MTAARAQPEDGHKMSRRVERERKEFELRTAVARALAAYREHASQCARRELERQASHLLKQVTGSMYPIIRLTDGYLLEVADAGRFHPLKRFSGGEQDLAALCLRPGAIGHARPPARRRAGLRHPRRSLQWPGRGAPRLLLQQLGELAENSDFQQIFVISHTDDVREHCRSHVAVMRENGDRGRAQRPPWKALLGSRRPRPNGPVPRGRTGQNDASAELRSDNERTEAARIRS